MVQCIVFLPKSKQLLWFKRLLLFFTTVSKSRISRVPETPTHHNQKIVAFHEIYIKIPKTKVKR